jgi:hypothetical protein
VGDQSLRRILSFNDFKGMSKSFLEKSGNMVASKHLFKTNELAVHSKHAVSSRLSCQGLLLLDFATGSQVPVESQKISSFSGRPQ